MPESFAMKERPFGGLFLTKQPEASSLPLRHTAVAARIFGPVAEVTVTQSYHNPFDRPLELEYLFPLPENGAIHDFEFRIGEATVTAEVQTTEAAQERYEQALHSGKHAGLFEERRPNLLALLLANVQPGDDITAVIRYQQPLSFIENSYEWVFPMGITPKYHQDRVSAEATDSPLALPGEEIGRVHLHVDLDAGQAMDDPFSPSHSLQVTRRDARRCEIELAGEQIPDRDFVLRYRLTDQEVQCPVWVSANGSAATALVTLVPNSQPVEANAPPREFVFVLDRSGSMMGEPLHQAANALSSGLRTLRSQDTFLLLAFDTSLEWFDRSPAAYSQESLERADRWLGRIVARGGTEIGEALEAALELPVDDQRQRHIVFFTDGAVSAEKEVLERVRRGIRDFRLFTFGIGPSVNRAFLSSLARLGRGAGEFLQLDEDIEAAIIRFHDRLSYPLLTDLRLRWQGTTAWDVLPAKLPDLYYGQPLQLCAKFHPAAEARLILSGRCGSAEWERSLRLSAAQGRDEAILRIWAKARIDALLDQLHIEPKRSSEYRDEIISLAVEHHLVTDFTSLIAVQEEVVSTAPAKRLQVAVPLPRDLERRGFIAEGKLFNSIYRNNAKLFSQRSVASTFFAIREDTFQQPSSRKNFLAGLARSQKADGSWGEGEDALEWTCAAVLAFVRQDCTLTRGPFRRILEKAVTWLFTQKPAASSQQRMRAVVLTEMSRVCAHPLLNKVDEEMKKQAQVGLTTGIVCSAEELRLAALSRANVEVKYKPRAGEVGEIWLESLVK